MKQNINLRKKNKIEHLAKNLLLVGDSNRLKILCTIFNKRSCCVSEIAKNLNLHIAIVSHHLQALSDACLIERKREGKRICYSFTDDKFIKDLKKIICKI